MTYLAISLYVLGVPLSASAVSRNEPSRYRKGIVVIAWPLVVAGATLQGLFTYITGRFPR